MPQRALLRSSILVLDTQGPLFVRYFNEIQRGCFNSSVVTSRCPSFQFLLKTTFLLKIFRMVYFPRLIMWVSWHILDVKIYLRTTVLHPRPGGGGGNWPMFGYRGAAKGLKSWPCLGQIYAKNPTLCRTTASISRPCLEQVTKCKLTGFTGIYTV